jgi:hypothetical protein
MCQRSRVERDHDCRPRGLWPLDATRLYGNGARSNRHVDGGASSAGHHGSDRKRRRHALLLGSSTAASESISERGVDDDTAACRSRRPTITRARPRRAPVSRWPAATSPRGQCRDATRHASEERRTQGDRPSQRRSSIFIILPPSSRSVRLPLTLTLACGKLWCTGSCPWRDWR